MHHVTIMSLNITFYMIRLIEVVITLTNREETTFFNSEQNISLNNANGRVQWRFRIAPALYRRRQFTPKIILNPL